jgi:hypothetical protein
LSAIANLFAESGDVDSVLKIVDGKAQQHGIELDQVYDITVYSCNVVSDGTLFIMACCVVCYRPCDCRLLGVKVKAVLRSSDPRRHVELVSNILQHLRSSSEPVNSMVINQIAQYFARIGDFAKASELLLRWGDMFPAGVTHEFHIRSFNILCNDFISKLESAHGLEADKWRQQLLDLYVQLVRVHNVKSTVIDAHKGTAFFLRRCGISDQQLQKLGLVFAPASSRASSKPDLSRRTGNRQQQHRQPSPPVTFPSSSTRQQPSATASSPQSASKSKSSAPPFSSF